MGTLPEAFFFLFFSEAWPPYFWKPLTCGYVGGYVAAGVVFQKRKKWKPLTCGSVAAGAFFFQKNGPHMSEAPNLWVRCSRLFFCSRKIAPIFLEAPSLWVRCRRRRFFHKKRAPIFLEALNLWVRCRRRLFFPQKRDPYFWARIMRARHGNPPPPVGRNGRVFNKARNIGISGI